MAAVTAKDDIAMAAVPAKPDGFDIAAIDRAATTNDDREDAAIDLAAATNDALMISRFVVPTLLLLLLTTLVKVSRPGVPTIQQLILFVMRIILIL